jgi:hypothetical protein
MSDKQLETPAELWLPYASRGPGRAATPSEGTRHSILTGKLNLRPQIAATIIRQLI